MKPDYMKKWVNQNKWIVIILVFGLILTLLISLTELASIWKSINDSPKISIQVIDPEDYEADCSNNLVKNTNNKLRTDLELDNDQYTHQEISQFYIESNQNFINYIDSLLVRMKRDSCQANGHTFLTGTAGAGKSFLRRERLSKFEGENFHILRLSKYFDRHTDMRNAPFENKVNLQNDNPDYKKTFGTLPYPLQNDSTINLIALLKLGKIDPSLSQPSIIVIDDIDEVHPSYSSYILNEICQSLNEATENCIPRHFIIMGRSEGFRNYSVQNRCQRSFEQNRVFELKPAKLITKGDLRNMILNYNAHEAELPVNVEKTLNNLIIILKKFPWVNPMLGNLSQVNTLIETASEGHDYTRKSLQKSLFSGLLQRNNITHGRPKSDNILYKYSLILIAKKYQCNINEDGYFNVLYPATISFYPVADCKNRISLKVEDVLNYSGLIQLYPFDKKTLMYRFEPRWVHEYLASENDN